VSAPIIIVIVLLLIPLLPILVAAWLSYAVVLQHVIWLVWCTRGTNVLLVYSDSTLWHDHIEAELVPHLPLSTIRLNWSERRTWKRFTLPVMAFRFFGQSGVFSPIVIVFRPFRWVRTFRLRKATFQDFKRGQPARLEEQENALRLYLSRTGLTKGG